MAKRSNPSTGTWSASSALPAALRDWQVNVSLWGRWIHPAGYRHPAMVSATDMLVWAESGTALYTLGTESFRVTANDLVYLPAEKAFFYCVAPDTPYRHCSIHFNVRNASGVSLERMGVINRLVHAPDPAQVARLFGSVEAQIERQDVVAYLGICSAIMQLLTVAATQANQSAVRVGEPNSKAYAAMAIIEREFRTPLSVKQLAARVHVTPEHLAKIFLQTFGISPKLQIRNLRMTLAHSLLMTGDKSIKEIAYAVGYASPNVFERAFREMFGCPPAVLRIRREPTVSGPTFVYRPLP